MQLARPATLHEAVGVLAADPEAVVISGGTAVGLMLRQGLIAPRTLVSIEELHGLDRIEVSDGGLRIGARVTLQDVASSAVVRSHAPALAYACARVGNVRVRNAATLAGNVAEADYASDPPSVLNCLDASCAVEGSSGQRVVPVRRLITDFYSNSLSHDEVITEISVPLPRHGERSHYEKYLSRSSEDRPCVGVAARGRWEDNLVRELHVVVGAVSSTPSSVPEVTDTAVGRPLDTATIAGIADGYAEAIEPIDDVRGTSWYRTQMIRVFVRRALQALRETA